MKCDCCGTTKNLAGVACSALGPISLCYCRTCADQQAEPLDMINYLIEECGGIDQVSAELLDLVTFYHLGTYASMRDLEPLPVGVVK